jgi:small subunit ribosomal protein S16
MVKIRLSRLGKKNDPFYRVVAIDSQRRREGRAISILGYWHPKKDIKKIDSKTIKEWAKKGAQVSKAVEKLIS